MKAEAYQRASLPGGRFGVVEVAPRVFDIGISKGSELVEAHLAN